MAYNGLHLASSRRTEVRSTVVGIPLLWLLLVLGCAGDETIADRTGAGGRNAGSSTLRTRLWFYDGYSDMKRTPVQPPVGRITLGLNDPFVAPGSGSIRINGDVKVLQQVEQQVIFTCEERDRRGRVIGGPKLRVVYPGTSPGAEPLGDREPEGLPSTLARDLADLRAGDGFAEVPADLSEYPVTVEWQIIAAMDRRWRSRGDRDLVHSSRAAGVEVNDSGRFRITLDREALESLHAVPVDRYQLLVRVSPRGWRSDQLHPRSDSTLVMAMKDPIRRDDVVIALGGGQ